MGKIARLILILCFSVNLFASNYSAEFKQFDANERRASKNDLMDYHNTFKGIYIKSIMNNDQKLKIQALKRLITTSKRLGFNSSAYEKELQTIDYYNKKDTKITPKNSFVAQKKDKPKIIKQNLKIVKIKTSSDKIEFILNDEAENVAIKNFVLNNKGIYRYVFDIEADLALKAQNLKLKNTQKIHVSQFKKDTTRIVFQSSKKLDIEDIKNDKSIILSLDDEPKTNKQNQKTIAKNIKKASSITIVIDAGHGGKDGGAQGGSDRSEKAVALQSALRLGKELKRRGFKVYYTRIDDRFIQLRDRTALANNKNADLFISLHANAAPNKSKHSAMQGVETFFLSPARSDRSKNVAAKENQSDISEMNFFSQQTYLNFLNREKILASNKLALDVQQGMLNSLRKKYKVKDGGVREAPFWVLVGAQMPAILVELGYITHPVEGKRLMMSDYQNYLANGIANGIVAYFKKNPI